MQKKSQEIQRAAGGAFRFGDFELYPAERQLKKRSKAVALPPKTFDALLILVRNAEHLVHRNQLIEALWPDTFVTDANLTNVIVSLRKILGRNAIQTVSKHGYRFTLQVVGEPGIDQDSYASFLQAKQLMVHRSLESVARARDLFSVCVANDPQFAAAWAWLGRSIRFLDKFNDGPSVNMDLPQAAFRRALAIDPHLAPAHHFYTQLQADHGQAHEAIGRLARLIAERGEDPESFAGLVQVLRFTGLLDESVAAHRRATSLDPTITTSVPHTHFLRGEYEATLDTYGATRYYLDAAAWAALGERRRATTALAERLATASTPALMRGLMGSLLDVLEDRRDQAIAVMQSLNYGREPESMFYLSRHLAMVKAPNQAVAMVRRARLAGFSSSFALSHDVVFEPLRRLAGFKREIEEAARIEKAARTSLARAGLRLTLTLAVTLLAFSSALLAQGRVPARGEGPWFGVELPPRAGAAPAVRVGTRDPRPVTLPPGEFSSPDFNGALIKADVATIVGFSRQSRAEREVGSGQMWGRIAGFASSDRTVAWAVEQFRKAGISDVTTQPIAQDPKAELWLPRSWQVRLLADPAFGAGSSDIVLESALPVSPSAIASGTMTAPLVYVGAATPSVLQHIDVKGKIAVQLIVPQGHMLFERGAVDARSDELMARGAAGVFNLVRLPGNELSRDFSNCGNPCFNIGGRDGLFLESVLDRAAKAGVQDKLRVRIDLQTQTFRDMTATNGVAIIPGRVSDETIVLNAHVDGWFDGAGDNGDGLAVLVALARHFAKPANRPARTIVLVASAGHHTPGINGPRSFVAANPTLASKAVTLINIEHVAQRNFSPARTTSSDGYREAVADSSEAPIAVGVTNDAPLLQLLVDEGPARYGVNFIAERSTFQSGETGGWASLQAAKVSVMQAPPLYHTTGEVLDVISAPGLERIARFLAFFVTAVDRAPRERINP